MNEEKSSRRGDIIAREAADWLVALADADAQTRKAFAAWLRLSPEHVKEFLCVSAIWGMLPELSSQPSIEELVGAAATEPNVVALPDRDQSEARRTPTRTPTRKPRREPGRTPRRERRSTPGRSSSRARWMGRAAGLLVAVAVGAILLISPPVEDPNLYATATGEQSSIPLPDGSLVTLNTRSTMRVRYSDEYRDVHLGDGEALFDVAKDTGRPFRVITEQAIIEAVGTQFSVRKGIDEVTVTVVEGLVEVSRKAGGAKAEMLVDGEPYAERSSQPVRLKVGQQAQVKSGFANPVVVDVSVEKATAWRQHRLVFEALPLKHVIEEFNRYNDPPTAIEDKELESLPISGVFRSIDRDSFLQFLAQMQLAESSTRADGTIVLRGMSGDTPSQ